MAIDRRKFIQTTTSATTALLLSSLDIFASVNRPALTADVSEPTNFDLKIMATNWGFKGSLDEYCSKVKKEGYDGIELWWPMKKTSQDELFAALKKYNLEVGFLCGANENSWKEHFESFKNMISAAATNIVQKPLYINCHSGKDFFTYEENKAFIDYTTMLAVATPAH